MKLYSDFAPQRTRQIIADLIAVAAIALWVVFGVTVYNAVAALGSFGEDMVEAGSGFRTSMTDVGDTLAGVPLIGGAVRAPFDGASSAGQVLVDAGEGQQAIVQQLALTLGVGIAVIPTVMILLLWLIPRVRFVRRAGRAQVVLRGGAGTDLLALRALATQKLTELSKVDADAMGAWRRGDQEVMRRLAALELKASGVRLRSPRDIPTSS
ncbi:hypothetical protein [Microbacterium invictum]|uniref:Uncharacterized protein n=1 Tax=Microbacterium invictum TaxID=515415 RepID=A0ABZ0VBZ1_9MICO|nr:hypothetical protein [Microbacterium invictum]WQB69660.1 hypothetical protein T9R20_13280 [Microbacterium invictum]